MKAHQTPTDWAFVTGITFAILSTVAFAAVSFYVFTIAPPG